MPIHTCNALPGVYEAIWTFVPHEVIDFSKFMFIRSLVIECYGPDHMDPPTARTPWCLLGSHLPENAIRCSGHMNLFECFTQSSSMYPDDEPYTLPSLRMFPLLEKIIIQNSYQAYETANGEDPILPPVYLKALTDLPQFLVGLEIYNSYITDIGSIVMKCPNLTILRLQKNKFPIHITTFSPSLYSISVMDETFTHDIHIPAATAIISFINSRIPYIHLDPALLTTPVVRHERLIVAGCNSPYSHRVLSCNKIKFLQKMQHIFHINTYRFYQHFGSIPSRIRINNLEEDSENPIIVVMKGLKSNYPRRMAEFFA